MNTNLLFDLEHNRSRLAYYERLQQKNGKTKPLAKWIEIYSERVSKLERQASRAGLKTQLDAGRVNAAARA